MGCAGNDELDTPNLDRIAATGIRFENFFCASPVCSPARASILTGQIPSQHGVQDFLRKGNSTHVCLRTASRSSTCADAGPISRSSPKTDTPAD